MVLPSLTPRLLKPKKRGEQNGAREESARLPKTKPEQRDAERRKKRARRRHVRIANVLSRKTRSARLASKKSAVLDVPIGKLAMRKKTDWLVRKKPKLRSVARDVASESESARPTNPHQDRRPIGENPTYLTVEMMKLEGLGMKNDACVVPST
jgi:hypothetical protein